MAEARSENLIRGIGVRQLAASIVNSTIGAGIFVLPALMAQGLGSAAPVAYLVCAVTMALVVTTFAMAASRVSVTGGLFAYVEAAFGPYIGFLAGTLQWLGAILAAGGVSIAFLDALTAIVPALHAAPARLGTLAAVLTTFAALNARGVRTGARTIELLTVGKLVPLALFVGVGAFFVQPDELVWAASPDPDAIRRAVLLLIFAFVGIEVALTPSGEVKRPAASVPRAIYLALGVTTALYLAIQLVAQGVMGAELAAHTQAPLADATRRFLGAGGAALMLGGTLISMLGYISGDALCSPRNLYAFGRDGFIPAAFARVHPVSRTPRLAIWTHTAVVFAIASSGSFAALAIVANIASLTLYGLACLAALRLMRRDVRTEDAPFVVPGARPIAVTALAAVLFVMSSATLAEFAATGVTLALASIVYLVRRRSLRVISANTQLPT
jgi:basic amino acid/polyamine antiporter, APA family